MGNTRSRYLNGILTFFEGVSQQTLHPLAPVHYMEDFLGKDTIPPEKWTYIDVSAAGNTTPLLAADVANGVLRLPLDSTSEAQESGVYWNDQRPLVLNQGLVCEMGVSLQTLPTLLGIGVWGLAGNKNAVADSVEESIWFRVDGSGAVTVETDDTVNEQTKVSTGVTFTAGQKKIFRIDCTDIANIKFYIDGVNVAGGTTFNMNTVPTLALQPYVHLAKASGAGLGVLDVDFIRVWQNRS